MSIIIILPLLHPLPLRSIRPEKACHQILSRLSTPYASGFLATRWEASHAIFRSLRPLQPPFACHLKGHEKIRGAFLFPADRTVFIEGNGTIGAVVRFSLPRQRYTTLPSEPARSVGGTRAAQGQRPDGGLNPLNPLTIGKNPSRQKCLYSLIPPARCPLLPSSSRRA